MSALGDAGQRVLRGGVGTLGGFRTFILRGNVVDLAVGIVIGAAFTTVVNGFVKDFLTPLINLALGSLGVKNLAAYVAHGPFGTQFGVGDFLNALLSFLIVAFIIYYFVVLPVNNLNARFNPKKPEPVTTRDCPYCLSAIPLAATRCAFCTSNVQPPTTTGAQ